MPKTTAAPWGPYARTILRRLREAENDSTFDPDIDMDGDTIAPRSKRAPSAVELLDALEHSQHQDSRDIEDLRAAGIDGYAMDDRGSDRPKVVIAPDKILMALRLAATFGSQKRFGSALDQRACTVITGFEPIQLSGAGTAIGRLFLPDGWTSQARPPRTGETTVLQLLRPMEIRHMLQRALPEERAEDLAALALALSGQTPAAIDARLRAAKAAARRAGGQLTARALRTTLPAAEPGRAAPGRRIAVHECGHAIVASLLGAVPVRRMQISRDGGSTSRASAIHEGTVPEFENELTILLAGRAAERLILGSISAGAGGSPDSDIAAATQLQLQFDRAFGLGIHGSAWLGTADMKLLSDDDRARLRVKLEQFERRARALLAPHRDLLERLADHLLAHRDLDETALAPWLSELAAGAAPAAPS
ncbi:hypothetical protein LZ190_20625 [Rhodovulum sulfidophilum]|nr:hypothetical protein [Rhodovulum sulfidophilum]